MVDMDLNWSDLKAVLQSGDYYLEYSDQTSSGRDGDVVTRYILAVDKNRIIQYHCRIDNIVEEPESGSDQEDFDAFYLTYSRMDLQIEPETKLPKTKPRPVEGTLDLAFIYFVVGDADSFDCGDETDWSFDVSTPGKTVLRYAPSHGCYIDGGGVLVLSGASAGGVACEVAIAPDIPPAQGGYVKLVRNKKLFAVGEKFTLETPPKYVKYYEAIPAASVVQLTITHDEQDDFGMEFYIKIYR